MFRHAIGCVLLAALLAGPAVAGENNSPKLTQETKDGLQITQDNITKMKLKTVQPQTPQPPTPSLGGPPAPPPSPPAN